MNPNFFFLSNRYIVSSMFKAYESVACMITKERNMPDFNAKKSSFLLSRLLIVCGLVGFLFIAAGVGLADQPRVVLADAVVCERISNFRPVNPAVVFSVSQGEVSVFPHLIRCMKRQRFFITGIKTISLFFPYVLCFPYPNGPLFQGFRCVMQIRGPGGSKFGMKPIIF